jgi:hypothetical protein
VLLPGSATKIDPEAAEDRRHVQVGRGGRHPLGLVPPASRAQKTAIIDHRCHGGLDRRVIRLDARAVGVGLEKYMLSGAERDVVPGAGNYWATPKTPSGPATSWTSDACPGSIADSSHHQLTGHSVKRFARVPGVR